LLGKNLSRRITSDIRQVASQVAEECKRSPLAIIILGRALRGRALAEWRKAFQGLNSELKEGESEEVRIVYRSVKLSYDHLEDNETKKCFLLCSLFPKNDPIAPQDLIRYAWGLGICQGIDSIEEVSKKVNVAIKNLKDSFLLLEHGKEHFQMQSGVCEAALRVISKDESFLMIKDVVSLWETPRSEDLESCSAISYVASKTEKLHGEEFRGEKLQILFLGGDGWKEISNEFLQWLKALKVFSLHHGDLSADALQNLTNLRALHLEHCKLNGLSSLGKLKTLEILSFRGSGIGKLPDEIGELDNLRLLDLFDCQELHRIPLNLIRKLSRLEELYFRHHSFEVWWSDEKRAEGSNPTPSNIRSPSSLAIDTLEYQKSIDNLCDTNSRPSKVSVFLQDQSKERNQTVSYLYRDHIVYHNNNVSPYVAQSVKKVRVERCNMFGAVFQDGFILCGTEDNSDSLLSDLTSLELEDLPNLRWIWYGKANDVSLQNLSTVKLKNCHRLKYLFSTSIAQRLEQLETLEIHGCNRLKQIIADTRDDLDVNETINPALLRPLCLPTLTTLKVTGCPALEYVFQITTGQILPKLTLLEIGSCHELAQVFSSKDAADGEDIEVPQLKRLSLKDLQNLKIFCSENRSIKLPALKQIEVEACHQFSNNAMCEVIKHCRLQEVCLIKVGSQLCGKIFELPGGYILSSLLQLTLEKINELQAIWKEPTQIIALQNLTHLKVVKCNKLKTLFSLLHARNLLQLSHLLVQECKDLEQIVAGDQISSSSSSSSRLKPVYFPNLKEISIEICNNLKSLFPVSVAHLPKLETLRVNKASKLKRIFIHEGEAKVKSEGEIVLCFPKLEVLHLEKLWNLHSIIPLGYECVFPVLKALALKECPLLATSFRKVDSEPIVYAKTKENSSTKEENNYSKFRRSVTFQELPNDWSPGMKID
ncbi:probable disease resistance protein At4g27220, partial [Herrania umbratica]|uniref:Probable disease resistance protein At4g27220 n=1 Tax=Herrania umbratica TaxID=108875 RepID=A0A6J1AKA7_9ROSI